MWTLWRYILRQQVGPFVFAFFVILFILVLDLLLNIMDAILGKGLGALVVLELFGLNFAWMIAIAVPMSVLVAALMSFGRLANDNEITAMMSAGVSPASMVVPSVIASAVIAGGLMWFNETILPDSNYRSRVLMSSVRRQKPAISLKDREGTFITDFPGYVLRVERVNLDATSPVGPVSGSSLEGVQVYQIDRSGRDAPTIVAARKGTIEMWEGGAVVRLVLFDGEMIQLDTEDHARDLRTAFDTQTIIIKDRERGASAGKRYRSSYRGDRELSSSAMMVRVRKYRSQYITAGERVKKVARDTTLTGATRRIRLQSERRMQRNYQRYVDRYLVEIHKHFSIPVACIVFVLVGAPLGMMARGAGRTVAVLGSVVLFLLYWSSLIAGEQLADRHYLPPWLAMWGANIIVGVLGVILLVAVTRDVRVASMLEALPRFLESRRRREIPDDETGSS
jgi:lipopolysaccharide export system permease protein